MLYFIQSQYEMIFLSPRFSFSFQVILKCGMTVILLTQQIHLVNNIEVKSEM